MTAIESVQRAIALVPWLLQHPAPTLSGAAERVGTSPAQVRHDLEQLCYCGGPGLGGGATFDIDFVGDEIHVTLAPGLDQPLRLSAAEATRLVLSLTAVVEVVGDRIPALASAVGKVRDAVGLDEAVVTASVDTDRRLGRLRTAIADGRVVCLSYRGRNDDQPRDRTVDPWHLEFTGDGWYLHAHDHDRDDQRVFLVDRVLGVEVTTAPVRTPAPPAQDLPTPRWVPAGPTTRIRLRLVGGARTLGDLPDTVLDHEVDGAREVVFDTDSLGWVTELIAAGGDEVTVVEPAEVAAMVRDHAREGLAARTLVARRGGGS